MIRPKDFLTGESNKPVVIEYHRLRFQDGIKYWILKFKGHYYNVDGTRDQEGQEKLEKLLASSRVYYFDKGISLVGYRYVSEKRSITPSEFLAKVEQELKRLQKAGE